MKSSADSPTPAPLASPPILTLTVHGAIPSFKTGKRGGLFFRDGKPFPMARTNPRHKARMQEIILGLLSQLGCASGRAARTRTDNSPHCSTALLLPRDDSAKWLARLTVEIELVPRGQEGADIQIQAVLQAEK